MEQLPSFLLFILLLVQSYLWYEDKKQSAKERQDLYNRLMSRDFDQYNQLVIKPEDNKFEDTKSPDVIDLDAARSELEGEETEEDNG